MQVSLIDFTGKGSPDPARHAANTLVFTKSTRLKMTPDLMSEIEAMPDEVIKAELEYMANTIPSSWEMCHYTFIITGVSRGFTHQFVRTRTGAYAQQTMRILDVSDFEYITGPTIDSQHKLGIYDGAMEAVRKAYEHLIGLGTKIEDARGVLPTNISTNICADFNLRTLSELFRKRASSRTQGEYRDVLDQMKAAVVAVHPWTDLFFNRSFDVAAAELEGLINDSYGLSPEDRTHMIKLIDQMRTML